MSSPQRERPSLRLRPATRTKRPRGPKTQRPTGRQTERPTGAEADRQRGPQAQRPTDREAYRPRGRQTERPTGGQRGPQADREVHRPRGRQTERKMQHVTRWTVYLCPLCQKGLCDSTSDSLSSARDEHASPGQLHVSLGYRHRPLTTTRNDGKPSPVSLQAVPVTIVMSVTIMTHDRYCKPNPTFFFSNASYNSMSVTIMTHDHYCKPSPASPLLLANKRRVPVLPVYSVSVYGHATPSCLHRTENMSDSYSITLAK